MQMTLESLNTKWWYRLLKVCYVLGFVVVCIVLIAIFFDISSSRKVVDADRTLIVCNYGNKKTLTATEAGVVLSIADYDTGQLSDPLRVELRAACQISQEEVQQTLSEIFKGNHPPALFDVMPAYKTAGGIWFLLSRSLILCLGTLLFFEIVRRVFYYVFLGSIFPKKLAK